MVTLLTVLALVAVLFALVYMYVESANCLFTFVMLQTSGAFSMMWEAVAALVGALMSDEK